MPDATVQRKVKQHSSARGVIGAYLTVSVLFILAASMIWAINTIFLMRLGGLTIFEVMLVNASFTVAQMLCEVPTGVVADTIGRKASMLLCMATLAVSTALYVLTPLLHWGIAGFFAASIILGLGFTFQTGAMDAWLVDALDACHWGKPKERVFAWGQMSSGAGMLVGSLAGGFLGQLNLAWPFVVRAVLLVASFVVVLVLVHDEGFVSRELTLSSFGRETRAIFDAGLAFGWRSPVIKPLLAVSALTGLFFIFGFYAWQPFVLKLLGRDYVWLLGVVQAGFSAATMLGNTTVGRLMRAGELRRDPAKVLLGVTLVQAVAVAAIAVVGFSARTPGALPAGLAIAAWLVWGFAFGISMPVRSAYINDYIPSAQRATVLSFDALFGDAGGAAGQPALGWVAQHVSMPLAWLVGGGLTAFAARFYGVSGAAARSAAREASHEAAQEASSEDAH